MSAKEYRILVISPGEDEVATFTVKRDQREQVALQHYMDGNLQEVIIEYKGHRCCAYIDRHAEYKHLDVNRRATDIFRSLVNRDTTDAMISNERVRGPLIIELPDDTPNDEEAAVDSIEAALNADREKPASQINTALQAVVAKHGDTVFLEFQFPVSTAAFDQVRKHCVDVFERMGVFIVVLPYDIKVARVEVRKPREPGVPSCSAISDHENLCTRQKGHEGLHHAFGATGKLYETWERTK